MADTTAIHAAITLLATAQSVTTAITAPTFARALSITGSPAGAALTGNVTLTGTDADGEAITETLALDGGNTVPGRKGFATVTSIALPVRTTEADTVSIGVATTLFSVAEARAFDRGQLANTATFSDQTILDTEAEIREQFAQIAGVPFIPATTSNYYLDGSGTATLLLPYPRVQAVTAGVIYDSDMVASETFDATDLADLAIYPDGRLIRRTEGSWPRGHRNVKLTLVHGFPVCPAAVRRAALMLCAYRLTGSDIDPRATSLTTDVGSITLSMGGDMTELPYVNTLLRQYDHTLPGIA